MDQPPRKLQKTDAGDVHNDGARREAYRDSTEPMDACTTTVHEQPPPAAASKQAELPRSNVQGAADEPKGLPVSQASLAQPETVLHRSESKRQSAGAYEHQQQRQHSTPDTAAAAGDHPHNSSGTCDEAKEDHSREVPCGGSLRGLPLRTVVAAYSRGHAGETTSEEERDGKVAGSRGSSQTRC